VKISVSVATLCLGVFASGAFAAEVSINGHLDESVEASNNYFLTNAPSGYTLKSLSAVNLGVLAATPTTRYLLDSNYSYYKYSGPGAKDSSLTWGTPASEKFSIDHTTPLSKYNFAMSWDRSDVATTALQQTGSAAGRGSVDTFKVDGGVKRDLTRIDSISWSANVTKAVYTDPNQSPYVDYSTNAAWIHRLGPTTTLTNSVNFDWLMVDNVSNSQRLFWNPMTTLQSQLSKRLSFNGAVGYAFVNAYDNGVAQPVIPTGATTFQQQTGAASDWVGNALLNYQLSNTTKVSLTAAKSIVPTVFGQLENVESIGSTLSHDINHYSSLTFFTQFSHIKTSATPTTGATASDVFTASANYGYKLTREWRTNLSYTYSQRNDQTGLAKASTVLFRLTRDFTLFGKPPEAVQKTPSELAQEDLARAQQALPTFIP
jgi:hypothetical protein